MARSLRSSKRPTDRELQAYVDGELNGKRRAEVEAALKRDPALRTVAQRYEAQKRGVQRLYDDVLNEPVPPTLAKLLKTPHKPRSRHH
jgi:anti-sigma factor RsiW